MKVSMKSFLSSLLLQSFNIYLQTTNNIVNMGILTINIDLPGLNEGAHDLLADLALGIGIESIFVCPELPLY